MYIPRRRRIRRGKEDGREDLLGGLGSSSWVFF